MKKIITLSTAMLFALSLLACNNPQVSQPIAQAPVITEELERTSDQIAEVTPPETTEAPEKKDLAPANWFDLTQAQVGDEVVDMTIVDLNLAENESIRPWGSKVTFKGEVEITGEYNYYGESEPFLSDNVCFANLTEESILKMPRVMEDVRDVWFCFSNVEEAQAKFGPPGSKGTATVVIDDYFINTLESEVWNTATLVEVL